jgi:hypothetical protein
MQSLVGILEDQDPKKRAYVYTEDMTFGMPGVPPVHGREEMLRRLETGEVLWDVTITPYNIDGCHTSRTPMGFSSPSLAARRITRASPRQCGSSWGCARSLMACGESPASS